MGESSLLERFLSEECNPEVRQLLCEALGSNGVGAPLVRSFEFNCFDVDLDFERDVATVFDVLDGSPEGRITCSLAELCSHLGCR